MTRDSLERHQVWWYLTAVLLGLLVGTLLPGLGEWTSALVWPVLALLLYATFTQLPLVSIAHAFRDGRFLAAALIGNFVLVPVVVWGLVSLVPDDPALRLGLLLVLLVPCTDWFITFTQLGRGDAGRATALTPISLLLQLLLLPVYLWLLAGVDLGTVFGAAQIWPALLVVLVPLALAWLTDIWARRDGPDGPDEPDEPRSGRGGPRSERQRFVERLGWWPVPLLAVVILLVAIAHVGEVRDNVHLLPIVIGVGVAYLVAAFVIAKALSVAAALPAPAGRTLAFSLGTRNSFIVLPFALSLPAGWEVAAIVVVMQSLVELFGMIFYLWFVPRVLFRDAAVQHG
ncbi:arsenic resistance protein [Ornithinimicrobium sp. Y1847]|uniref:arsenic resistance protein n=1 Tax=Ornithinimicrobium sp. Y1847 TaxID=3405419 RepID=UPI003B671791